MKPLVSRGLSVVSAGAVLLAACGGSAQSPAAPSSAPAPSTSPVATEAGTPVPTGPAMAHLQGRLVFDHVANHFVSLWADTGAGAQRLFPEIAEEQEQASWSFDGSALTFDELLPNGSRIFTTDLVAAPIAFATECRPPTCLEEGFPSRSPDGSTVAFRRLSGDSEPTGSSIGIADASGANAKFTPGPSWSEGEYKSPRWSPDGAFLVFALEAHKDASGAISGSSLYVLTRADGTVRRLTEDGLSAAAPDWSASGLIVFGSDPGQADGAPKDIYVINPDGTGLRKVTAGTAVEGAATTPRWIPGTDRIVFSHITGATTADIWVINADGTGAEQVTATGGQDSYPAFAPS